MKTYLNRVYLPDESPPTFTEGLLWGFIGGAFSVAASFALVLWA